MVLELELYTYWFEADGQIQPDDTELGNMLIYVTALYTAYWLLKSNATAQPTIFG